MSKPTDLELYNKIKKEIYLKIPKNSAYRSGLIVKKYKEEYFKKYKNNNSYSGIKDNSKGLSRWFKEEWKTQDNKTTYSNKNDIFRPTKRITKDTPTTMKELTKKQIENAMKEKSKTKRVKKYNSI